MIYYVSIRAHVLDDKSSETDVFCDFGLSTISNDLVMHVLELIISSSILVSFILPALHDTMTVCRLNFLIM